MDNKWLSDELYYLGLSQARLLYPEAPEDILHDVLENFQKRIYLGKLLPENVNKNLLFISIRNAMYSLKQKQASQRKKLDGILEQYQFLGELDYSDINDKKMGAVDRVYHRLNEEDRNFFLERFVGKVTKKICMQKYRLTSEEFNSKVEYIKELIKEDYGKTKEN